MPCPTMIAVLQLAARPDGVNPLASATCRGLGPAPATGRSHPVRRRSAKKRAPGATADDCSWAKSRLDPRLLPETARRQEADHPTARPVSSKKGPAPGWYRQPNGLSSRSQTPPVHVVVAACGIQQANLVRWRQRVQRRFDERDRASCRRRRQHAVRIGRPQRSSARAPPAGSCGLIRAERAKSAEVRCPYSRSYCLGRESRVRRCPRIEMATALVAMAT